MGCGKGSPAVESQMTLTGFGGCTLATTPEPLELDLMTDILGSNASFGILLFPRPENGGS
jgi:hypothetical protein